MKEIQEFPVGDSRKAVPDFRQSVSMSPNGCDLHLQFGSRDSDESHYGGRFLIVTGPGGSGHIVGDIELTGDRRSVARASKLSWASLDCEIVGTLDRIDRVTQLPI